MNSNKSQKLCFKHERKRRSTTIIKHGVSPTNKNTICNWYNVVTSHILYVIRISFLKKNRLRNLKQADDS